MIASLLLDLVSICHNSFALVGLGGACGADRIQQDRLCRKAMNSCWEQDSAGMALLGSGEGTATEQQSGGGGGGRHMPPWLAQCSAHGHAAVDGETLAGDVRGGWGRGEGGRGGRRSASCSDHSHREAADRHTSQLSPAWLACSHSQPPPGSPLWVSPGSSARKRVRPATSVGCP